MIGRAGRARWWALVALWPIAVAVPADAQDIADGRGAGNDSARGQLDDIIVTARRRPESLQRVPQSIVVLTAADLDQRSITNTRTLQNFVPNLTFAASQNVGEAAGNIFIRGIGQEDFGIGADPGVGVYVDGVYLARTLGTVMNLTDIARVEVLRGPQGTLFGKNTIGGAISLVSVMPGPEREHRFNLILGNDRRIEARGIANEPLSDRLYARLSVGIVNRGGYLRRLAPPVPLAALEQATHVPIDRRAEGDDHSQAVRLQLRWLAGDRLTADLSLDGSRKRSAQSATHLDAFNPGRGDFPDINGLIADGKLPGPPLTSALVRANPLESYATGFNFTRQSMWGGSAVLTRDLGPASVKFIGSYRGLRSHVGTDNDGLYFNVNGGDLRVDQRQLSGELQLQGSAGRLTYTAGLFGFGERSKLRPTVFDAKEVLVSCGCYYAPGEIEFTAEPRQLRSASYAGYAQGTYRVTDRLSATLGGRYTHELKQLDGKVILLDANLKPTATVLATGHNRDRWNAFTYRAGLDYQASRAVMAYGSVATGFKSGGFNVRGEADLPNLGFVAFDPETAVTYELGLRSEWLERRLRFNATLFHTDYRDIQLRQLITIDGVSTTVIQNAARARIRGVELELTALPVRGLTLRAAYGHLAPRYLDVGEVARLSLDSRFQRSPSHTFAGSVNYQMPLGSGTLELHGDYSYRSREQFQIVAASNDQPGYGLLGAQLSFRPRGERWALALFGSNLTDRRYRVAGRGTLLNESGIAYSSIGMPRQLGVQLTTAF